MSRRAGRKPSFNGHVSSLTAGVTRPQMWLFWLVLLGVISTLYGLSDRRRTLPSEPADARRQA